MEKIFKIFICSIIMTSFISSYSFAEENPEYYEQVYLSDKDAISLVFGDLKVEKKDIDLSDEKRKIIQKKLKRKIKDPSIPFYIGTKNGNVQKYALILDEVGKHFPITFIVSMDSKATVDQVAIMTYREKRGDAVKRKRFLNQFKSKGVNDPMEVNNDLISLTGATISSWSVASGVKKAVVLTEELMLKNEKK